MKRLLIILLAAASALVSCGQKTTTVVNPLTYSDTPDPDVIRVGKDFYMVTTTMYFCPMVPIMHSRDLVHWEIVSYVLQDLGDIDNYTFTDGRNAYGKGQWATSLKYHDGYYYVLFITNETHKTYIYRTDDITRSNWDRVSVIDEFFHDATLFWDDDQRVYVVYGNTQLRVTELEADLSGVKAGGVDEMIIEYRPQGHILGAEGSRFFKRDGWYYLLEIDWPGGSVRTQRCWRSRDITGPYEEKVVCQGTLGGRGDGIAQGTIVDTPRGDWYAIVFQDHGAVGRIVTLQPVTWTEEWPMMGDNGVPMESFEVNLKPWGEDYLWASDEFDGKTLPLVWQWNHKPLDGCWSLTEREGWLRLTAGQIASGISDARNTLTQRTVGPACESIVKLDASGLKEGDFAGICTFQSNRVSVGIRVDSTGRNLAAVAEGFRRPAETVFCEPAESDVVWLRLRYDFTDDLAFASFSYDGEKWTDIDYAQKMRFSLDYFTGYRTGLFCFATAETGGYADFDFFHQNKL
ncbi:MAG: glycoside hydrolase 43 family protein [Bacteroidales bacterium]|nr:glycoside hydrolase 43 family protein [Bacteroidales bacterium]